MQFYAFHLQDRRDHFNAILRSGRLLQEFLVDAYAQIEQGRLRFIRCNQAAFRVELYQGLADAVTNGMDLDRVGSPIVLPSSFPGGPRYMSQLYHDAMAIVRSCGKPDLFITMTCNPQWPAILNALKPGQTPQDRPDIVARVFRLKFKALLSDIVKRKFFGPVTAHIHVIEFQKRGLLMRMSSSSSLRNTNLIRLMPLIASCAPHSPAILHCFHNYRKQSSISCFMTLVAC